MPIFPLDPVMIFDYGYDYKELMGYVIDMQYNGYSPMLDELTGGVIKNIAGELAFEVSYTDAETLKFQVTDMPNGWIGFQRVLYGIDSYGDADNRGIVDGHLMASGGFGFGGVSIPEPSMLRMVLTALFLLIIGRICNYGRRPGTPSILCRTSP